MVDIPFFICITRPRRPFFCDSISISIYTFITFMDTLFTLPRSSNPLDKLRSYWVLLLFFFFPSNLSSVTSEMSNSRLNTLKDDPTVSPEFNFSVLSPKDTEGLYPDGMKETMPESDRSSLSTLRTGTTFISLPKCPRRRPHESANMTDLI